MALTLSKFLVTICIHTLKITFFLRIHGSLVLNSSGLWNENSDKQNKTNKQKTTIRHNNEMLMTFKVFQS